MVDMCQYLKTSHIINVCELETLNGLKHMKKYINIIPFVKNTYKINNSCIFNVFNYILTELPASNFVDSGGKCNTEIEGQKDTETSDYAWIEETDTAQANSDLVGEIRFLPNSAKPTVTHTMSDNLFLK